MALDVYVGTMTRFYRREWENVMQRRAREQGKQYRMIHPGGEPAPPPAADVIRDSIARWCAALSSGMAPHGVGPVTWDEADDQPYFTDRPAWDGYSAMLIWAAHTENPDLATPKQLPQSWLDDPAYQRSTSRDFKSRFGTILTPQLWLPIDFAGIIEASTPASEEPSPIGSVFALKEQLETLYSETASQFRSSLLAEPKPIATAPKRGLLNRFFGAKPSAPKPQEPTLIEMADLGLRIFRDLAAKACENKLPLMLHY